MPGQAPPSGAAMSCCDNESRSMAAGEFARGAFNGQGTYAWTDGRQYHGEFEDGVLHGHGKFIDARGREYFGQFTNGSGPGLTYNVTSQCVD